MDNLNLDAYVRLLKLLNSCCKTPEELEEFTGFINKVFELRSENERYKEKLDKIEKVLKNSYEPIVR